MSYNTGEADARGSGVQGPPQLCRELDASLGYMRLRSLKKSLYGAENPQRAVFIYNYT